MGVDSVIVTALRQLGAILVQSLLAGLGAATFSDESLNPRPCDWQVLKREGDRPFEVPERFRGPPLV